MKNLIFLSFILSVGLFLFSCAKVETPNATGKNTTTSVSGSTSSTNTLKTNSGWSTEWIWDLDRKKCWPTPLDCFDPVNVKPHLSEIFMIFNNDVDGDASKVKDFFTNQEWQLLFPLLEGTDYLTRLQSGNYDMIRITSDDNSMLYYAAGKNLPLTAANEEFVLQVHLDSDN